jgi:hypothetical protein
MTVLFAAGLALAAGLAPCSAQESSSTLKSIELYRSSELTIQQIENTLGPELRTYAQLRGSGRKAVEKAAEEQRAHLEKMLLELGPVAFAQIDYSQYITSAQKTAYITLEIVDKKDAAARMPFRKPPQGSRADPHGLLAAWADYQRAGLKLRDQGAFDAAERPSCPGFYCTWGSAAPELAGFERRFSDGARGDRKALIGVLEHDRDPANRAAALSVLSYGENGDEVAAEAVSALQDPAPEVRAAALDILSDIAAYHKNVFIEVSRVISALDYPLAVDRAKAMSVLVGLADRAAYRPYVVTRGAPYLSRLLKLQQPSNHDLAFTLLSMLSQQAYDQHDYDAWDAWADGVQKSTAAVTVPPAPPIKPRARP